MKTKSLLYAIILCLPAISCNSRSVTHIESADASVIAPYTAPAQSTQPTDPAVFYGLDYQQYVDEAKSWVNLQGQTALAGGIEPQSAGLHVLYSTVRDPDVVHPSFPSLQENHVRDWRFWRAKPYYSAPYTASDAIDSSASRSASCHIHRATVNAILQYSISVDSTTNLYSVEGLADSRAIAVLRAMSENQSTDVQTGDFVDWYGISRISIEEPTPLRLVVASNNFLYRPMDITGALYEIDSQGLTSYPFTIADDLTAVEANSLKALLEQ